MLKAVTAGDLQKLYGNFVGGTHGELVIVGDFDRPQCAAIIESILADWKAEMPYAHISRDVKSESAGRQPADRDARQAQRDVFRRPGLSHAGR